MAAGSTPPVGPGADAGPAAGFRLLRYFNRASLAVFAALAAVMLLIEHSERDLFQRAQADQAAFFRQTQETFARHQEAAAQSDLLRLHEAGHVNLTRLFANVLWQKDIAPFVARAQAIGIEGCRNAPPAERAGCFKAVGAAIAALPGFRMIDARVAETMQKTSVFKIKVFDLRGITIYSSEQAQIGEDKIGNQGWKSAIAGRPVSELTHRNKFSAFEGVVENRDLISSYVPVRVAGGEDIFGVFEIYSDVTALLEQIRDAGARVRALSKENQESIERTAAANQKEMDSSSYRLLAIVAALLLILYATLYLVARHAQGIIDRREREREAAIVREQRAHAEKMASLSGMAADIAHEIANPLAVISSYAEQVTSPPAGDERRALPPRQLLEQTRRISFLLRRIADFTRQGSEHRETVDVNQTVRSVCDFMAYDRRFRATRVDFRGAADLPACVFLPDLLTEVLMNVLQVCVGGDGTAPERVPHRIEVRTERRDDDATAIVVACDLHVPKEGGAPDWTGDPRIEATRRIVAGMGGQFLRSAAPDAGIEIVLPGIDAATAGLA